MKRTAAPSRPSGLTRTLYRLPIGLYRAHLGILLGHRFVLINHIGRRTGLPRQVVVEVVARNHETGAVIVASGFGAGSDWYRNLLAHPEVSIQVGAQHRDVRAIVLPPERSGDVMVDYARRHPRAARALAGYMGFETDGSEDDARAVGRELPMLLLDPVAEG